MLGFVGTFSQRSLVDVWCPFSWGEGGRVEECSIYVLHITKGSVSYLSLLAKAYCRQGHVSGPDFGVLYRENHLRGGTPDPPGSPFLGV